MKKFARMFGMLAVVCVMAVAFIACDGTGGKEEEKEKEEDEGSVIITPYMYKLYENGDYIFLFMEDGTGIYAERRDTADEPSDPAASDDPVDVDVPLNGQDDIVIDDSANIDIKDIRYNYNADTNTLTIYIHWNDDDDYDDTEETTICENAFSENYETVTIDGEVYIRNDTPL
jgi:hypothetical protein